MNPRGRVELLAAEGQLAAQGHWVLSKPAQEEDHEDDAQPNEGSATDPVPSSPVTPPCGDIRSVGELLVRHGDGVSVRKVAGRRGHEHLKRFVPLGERHDVFRQWNIRGGRRVGLGSDRTWDIGNPKERASRLSPKLVVETPHEPAFVVGVGELVAENDDGVPIARLVTPRP